MTYAEDTAKTIVTGSIAAVGTIVSKETITPDNINILVQAIIGIASVFKILIPLFRRKKKGVENGK